MVRTSQEAKEYELPPPPKGVVGHLKAIGPGIILASMAIGAGEWYLFPAMIVKYGPGLMWTAAVGCIVQAVLGAESIKYTLYCGQPIHQAYMKLGKPIAWAWAWALMLFIPVMWPGWASASATAIAALQLGRVPGPGDSGLVLAWGIILLFLCLFILHVGEKIQRTLEVVNWPVVVIMIVLVAAGTIIGAPAFAWGEVAKGIFTPHWPRGLDWFLVASAIAYMPAGFGFNLMLSSYARDKGWGMGARVGFISAIIGGRRVKISTEEVPFKMDEENLRRWRGWVNTARIDSWIVMSLLTFITVFFTSTLAYGLLVPRGLAPMGFACATVQAQVLSEVIGPAAWFLILFSGFLILIGTQMGLMDSVARVITDNFWVASERARKWSKEDPRRFYYAVLYLLFAVALVLLIGMIGFGWASPFELTAIGSCLGLFALFIAFLLQIIVNYKFLPKQLRPSIVTTIILVIGTVWNLVFLAGLAVQVLTGVRL
ncbi:MAG: Nramp family divalent metal transporter [Candidatus Nezhaarchaeales archaeon]